MLVGAMNNPALPIADEIARVAALGLDFVDLTLEAPAAWPADGCAIAAQLRDAGVVVVGHTSPFLPLASPYPELREQAHRILIAAFDEFAATGARVVNVHPDPINRLFAREEIRERNAAALAHLSEEAEQRGLRLMVENLRAFGTVDDFAPVFEAAPRLGLHLDVGHAQLGLGVGEANRSRQLLDAFGDRLAHVHVHDNDGVDDLHLPLGTGTVPWAEVVAALKRAGYDSTVTLEVLDRSALPHSRELWLEWWNADG